MKLNEFFIGRPIYWALTFVVAAIFAYLGSIKMHVRHFESFQFILLGLAVVVVGVIVATYKPGERIVRDGLNPDDLNKTDSTS